MMEPEDLFNTKVQEQLDSVSTNKERFLKMFESVVKMEERQKIYFGNNGDGVVGKMDKKIDTNTGGIHSNRIYIATFIGGFVVINAVLYIFGSKIAAALWG